MAGQRRTGFEGSPEVGGKDKDRREQVDGPESGQEESRPRGGGFLGDNDGDENDDPIQTTRGLLSGIEEVVGPPQAGPGFGGPGQEREVPSATSGKPRPDRRPPPEEEEDPILPGDPDDLGARGRRRRQEDDDTPSPVLRRGLLGV